MENTIDSKAKFFAQYWGQEVVKDENVDDLCEVSNIDLLNAEIKNYESYLVLNPLSMISVDDISELSKICNSTPNDLMKAILSEMISMDLFPTRAGDFLRSKGYALPFMGLSVEKMVEHGWIKLKTESDAK